MPKSYAQRIVLNIIEEHLEKPNDTIAEDDAGEYLRDRFGERDDAHLTRNQLVPVRVPEPATLAQAQLNKTAIIAALNLVEPVAANSILYVIAHADPESKRFAGLDAGDWADILGNRETFKALTRIHLVGCHAAGDAHSAAQATSTIGMLPYSVTGYFSLAGVLHDRLKNFGLRAELAAYCSYVRISPGGELRSGFEPGGARTRHAEATKVVFSWDDDTTRSMRFPH